MVLNHVWARTGAGGGIDYFPPADVTDDHDGTGHLADGSKVEYRGMLKMGKTERNGIDPQDLIDRYGADTARLFVMFASPPEQTLDWNDAGVEGASRFLRRLWKFASRHAATVRGTAGKPVRHLAMGPVADLRRELHTVLRQIQYDYERLQYNTVVSGAMKLLNALEAHASGAGAQPNPAVLAEGLEILVGVLYPICPHTAWVLWQELGFEALRGTLLDAPWPEVDIEALAAADIELVLQVNGKTRGTMRAAADTERGALEAAALATPEVQKFVAGQTVKRIVVVPNRLVNVVVG
jgi:leucyl-tRNA synthetase